MQYLQKTASGANVGNNPYLNQMVSNQQDQIANRLKNITNPGIDSQAAAIGRMGSGAYATQRNNAESVAANEMAKVATDMYGNQYNQDVSNQMNAANAYGALYNQNIANNQNQQANDRSYQLSGMNTLSNNYQNNISNMLGLNDQKLNAANASVAADSSLASQKLNAANMAGQTYQNQYLPSQQLANVGATQDQRLE
ncbi:Phage protein [Rhizobium sp. UR51a]|nr:Phage protein [Rhizobium sp. UR51a]